MIAERVTLFVRATLESVTPVITALAAVPVKVTVLVASNVRVPEI